MAENHVRRLDRGMAEKALRVLRASLDENAPEDAEPRVGDTLRTRMRALPQRLHGGGFAATYAFLVAKSNGNDKVARAYRQLSVVIAEHVRQEKLLPDSKGPEKHGDPAWLLRELATNRVTPSQYARLSAEVLQLATWLRRLADALYEPDTDGGGQDGE
ncbi:CRISPR-associated protein Cmr5 family [Haloactinospora alba]|uniref:CRISPR type III-B/RAMP module-associated protein Cmr5 n=1 Tax=Haloactinospora alba TaxID=405555 RepID=A0A543N9V9_9ACTN|nr:type III-B CRISPR module-associated protein Cmr5 [Haloactinospora alba]TQN28625.1 CRISPR-associated protein Cmr5 family [Haloactinospora alba]